MKRETYRKDGKTDAGVALILVLLAMLVLSVLAAAMVFTSRTETFASYNYKLDTQADYLAKAGIERAVNWFESNHYQAVSPAQAALFYAVTSTGSPSNLLTSNASPIVCISGCSAANGAVQLIGYGSGSTNYPDINNTESTPVSVASAFASDLNSAGSTRITADSTDSGFFNVNAQLLSYGTVYVGDQAPFTATPVETWLITSKATWTGGSGSTRRLATAEEQAILQPVYVAAWSNALYGFCSVSMSGSAGTCTDGFNSSLGPYGGGNPSVAAGKCDSDSTNVISSGAGVGANGGVSLTGNVTVSGDVTIGSNPSAGCAASGYSGSGNSVLGEVVNGPHMNPPPVATFRSGFPGAAPSYSISGTQVLPVGAAWSVTPFPQTTGVEPATSTPCMDTSCNGTQAHPYEISSISMSGSSAHLELVGGPDADNPVYYDVDSLSQTGGEIDVSGYVVINVKSSLSIAGKGVTNGISTSIPPECVVINYAGTGTVSISGNGAVSALLNAPQGSVSLGGGGSAGYLVGAIQAMSVNVSGGYPVHFDQQLLRTGGGSIGVMVTSAYGRKKM